jgi:ubiquinone/menaquinone biosynthesis C-methylase UbiE
MNARNAEKGQVTDSAAEVYDEYFVPALFEYWAEPLCAACGIKPGDAVLDVACGTGATTRLALDYASPGGTVTGLDINDGMLAVAKRRSPDIRWMAGPAEDLPFDDGAFDRVLCQFGLMFFEDKSAALKQMARVLRPGGSMAVSVWTPGASTSAYPRMKALVEDMFGQAAGDALRAPFSLGDKDALRDIVAIAGLANARIDTQTGQARFPSIREWMRMDARGWTLADLIDDDGFEALVAAAETELAEFADPDGRVAFPTYAHIVTWAA